MKSKEEKLYRRIFKKQRKALIKMAKQFQPYDYGYLEDMLAQMLSIFYEHFKRPELLAMDTKDTENDWKGIVNSLKTCVDLSRQIHLSERDADIGYHTISDCRRKLYTTIMEHITTWWD